MKIYPLIITLILVLSVVSCSGPGKYDTFAKCLTERNATMFGAFWCSHCQAQKKSFGSSWQYVNYVECSTPDGQSQTEYCALEKITGYPTWQFVDSSRLSGEVSFDILAEKTGCVLN